MTRLSCTLLAASATIAGSPISAAPITALTFSPDGAALVSNGDRLIAIRSPSDATIRHSIPCDIPKIATLAFSPDSRWLAVGGGEPGARGELLLLTWPRGVVAHRLGDHGDLVTASAFDHVGTRLAIASNDHTARIWNLPKKGSPTLAFTLEGHAGPVLAIAFSPSGKSIITASADRSLKAWSAEDGRLLRSFSQHTDPVHTLAFRPLPDADPSPATCASGGDDRTVRVWQPEIGRMVRIVRHHAGPIFALAWSPDGSSLYSAGKEGIIRRIGGSDDSIQARWHAHDDWIYALALSPDGSLLASGDWSGTVKLHDPLRASDKEHQNPIPPLRP